MTQARNGENREMPTGALRGIRVLDFGHYIPGPLLGMLLADQGADVIKVERPGGDPARQQPAFATGTGANAPSYLTSRPTRGVRRPGN
jgi:crotonobetainyl-CoA:carnitine CoA-transferase CaiB-like acyl-CoA transferase